MRTEEADEAAIDIATSLTSAGVTYKTARRIVSFFRSPELADLILNEHPYRLMDVPGLGWERADALARKLGFAPDHPERLRAAAVHAMERAQANGHSALPVEELAEFVSELVGADHAEPAVTLALDAAEIVEDGERSYLPASLEAEWTIASRLRRHLMASLRMTTREESKVDDVLARAGLSSAQEAAVRRALVSGCFILTGGPGTGKTSTLRAYVECLRSLGKTVRVAAPTGKAAARANEVVGGLAETIHRMIGGPPGSPRATPVEADALVIEETSMCSLEVFSWLLSSLRPTTQLLLVGDVEQLPSVDHGAILRDLLFSRTIPSARLTEVFRQAEGSSIIANAHRALAGAELVSDRHSFLIVDVSAPTNEGQVARALNRLMDALDWLIQSEGVAPATDLQVLSPLKRGPLGVEKLNVLLQGKLNPHGRPGPRIGGGARVRVGDRVFQMRNDYTLGESGVFNGEQGVVRAVGPDRVLVGWGDGREIVVEGFRRYNLELGWATTVHRAQGSEFPNVLGLFTRTHGAMLSRPILYTAITRARERFIMITDDVARSRLREADQDGQARHTGLVRHLRQRLPEVA
mgnify:FL=1